MSNDRPLSGRDEHELGDVHEHGPDEEFADDVHDHEHDHHHHDVGTLGVAVVTVSSTRAREDDPSGDVIQDTFEAAGHEVVVREIVRDRFDSVQGTVNRLVNRDDTHLVVTTGGTGVTPDDVTIEAVEPLFEKRLPGFGELFRSLSREDIGTRVVATRATAGIADAAPVFCLPGSADAARLGTAEILVPEAPHLAGLARRGLDEDEEE